MGEKGKIQHEQQSTTNLHIACNYESGGISFIFIKHYFNISKADLLKIRYLYKKVDSW